MNFFQLLVFFAILTVVLAGPFGPGVPDDTTTPTTPWTQTTPKEGIVSKFHRFLEAAYLSPGNFWTYFFAFLENFNVAVPIAVPIVEPVFQPIPVDVDPRATGPRG